MLLNCVTSSPLGIVNKINVPYVTYVMFMTGFIVFKFNCKSFAFMVIPFIILLVSALSTVQIARWASCVV